MQNHQLGTTHSGAHRNQHYDGDYFGPNGALAKSREALSMAMRRRQQEPLAVPKLRRDILSARVALMSTMASVIGHSAAQAKAGLRARSPKQFCWHVWQLVWLTLELSHMVAELASDNTEVAKLDSGERDVVITSLIKMAPIGMLQLEWWYRRAAAKLIRYQVDKLPQVHGASLFAKGRAVEGHLSGYFSAEELDDFREDVEYALTAHAPDGRSPLFSWEEVARLARMVGDTDRQQYAATMDGRADALLKAGLPTN